MPQNTWNGGNGRLIHNCCLRVAEGDLQDCSLPDVQNHSRDSYGTQRVNIYLPSGTAAASGTTRLRHLKNTAGTNHGLHSWRGSYNAAHTFLTGENTSLLQETLRGSHRHCRQHKPFAQDLPVLRYVLCTQSRQRTNPLAAPKRKGRRQSIINAHYKVSGPSEYSRDWPVCIFRHHVKATTVDVHNHRQRIGAASRTNDMNSLLWRLVSVRNIPNHLDSPETTTMPTVVGVQLELHP